MPTLKQLTCTIEWSTSGTSLPLPEYQTSYSDGIVETYIAVPPLPTPFSIRLKSDGYIAPGLSMFVYIDGEYQCNRGRNNLKIPDGRIPTNQTEVNFVLRQKEEAIAPGDFFEEPAGAERNGAYHAPSDDYIGLIEVTVLRSHDLERSMIPRPSVSELHPVVFARSLDSSRLKTAPGPKVAAALSDDTESDDDFDYGKRSTGFGGIFDGASDDPDFALVALPFGGDGAWGDEPDSHKSSHTVGNWDKSSQSGQRRPDSFNTHPNPWGGYGQGSSQDGRNKSERYGSRPPNQTQAAGSNAGVSPTIVINVTQPGQNTAGSNWGVDAQGPSQSGQDQQANANTGWDNQTGGDTGWGAGNDQTQSNADGWGNDANNDAQGQNDNGNWDKSAGDSAQQNMDWSPGNDNSGRSQGEQNGNAGNNPPAGDQGCWDSGAGNDRVDSGWGNNMHGGAGSNSVGSNGNGSQNAGDANGGTANRQNSGDQGWNSAPDNAGSWGQNATAGGSDPSKPRPRLSSAGKAKSARSNLSKQASINSAVQKAGWKPSTPPNGGKAASVRSFQQPKAPPGAWPENPPPAATTGAVHRGVSPTLKPYHLTSNALGGPMLPVPSQPRQKSTLEPQTGQTNVSRQVQEGPPVLYRHKTAAPKYIDGHEKPYATFIFRYRSKAILEQMFNIQIPESKEVEKARLTSLSKEELIEQVIKAKSKLSSDQTSASSLPSKLTSAPPSVNGPNQRNGTSDLGASNGGFGAALNDKLAALAVKPNGSNHSHDSGSRTGRAQAWNQPPPGSPVINGFQPQFGGHATSPVGSPPHPGGQNGGSWPAKATSNGPASTGMNAGAANPHVAAWLDKTPVGENVRGHKPWAGNADGSIKSGNGPTGIWKENDSNGGNPSSVKSQGGQGWNNGGNEQTNGNGIGNWGGAGQDGNGGSHKNGWQNNNGGSGGQDGGWNGKGNGNGSTSNVGGQTGSWGGNNNGNGGNGSSWNHNGGGGRRNRGKGEDSGGGGGGSSRANASGGWAKSGNGNGNGGGPSAGW